MWAWDRIPYTTPRRLDRPPVDPIMDLADEGALPRGPLAMRYVSNVDNDYLPTNTLLIKM